MQQVYVFSGYCNKGYSCYTDFYLSTNPTHLKDYFTSDIIERYEDVSVYLSYIRYTDNELPIPDDNNQLLLVTSYEKMPNMEHLYTDCDNDEYYYIAKNLPIISPDNINLEFMYNHYDGNKYRSYNEIEDQLTHYQKYKDKLIMFCSDCNIFYTIICKQHPDNCYFSI